MKIITIFYGKNRGDFSGTCCYDVKIVPDDYDITPTHASWKDAVYSKTSGKTWCLIEVREYQENPPKLGPVLQTIFEAPPRVERVEINKQAFPSVMKEKKFTIQPNLWAQWPDMPVQAVYDGIAELPAVPMPAPQPGEAF